MFSSDVLSFSSLNLRDFSRALKISSKAHYALAGIRYR